MYLKHSKGKVLTIHSDCSYAGCWIKALVEFLDEKEVQPCGHSARDKGILLKVFASCQTNEIASKLAYSIRGANTFRNILLWTIRKGSRKGTTCSNIRRN